jgi:DNA-binding MarR family transcriptional regulator
MKTDRSNHAPSCLCSQTAASLSLISFNAEESLTQLFSTSVQNTANQAETGQRVDFISPRLAAAMSHPTRVYAMGILTERDASPRELAEDIGEPLNNVTYHVNQLRELGCIELVRTERARGGRVLEHFYRATQRPYFDDDAWEVLTEKERLGVIWSIAQMISKDITAAVASGTFFAEDDKHITRSPMRVDDAGWREISELLNRTAKELFEIEERVAERTAGGGSAAIDAKVEIIQFRSPPGG